mmetsp:Transcript_801/g.1689  ORF Transcript_801/g.1689 Transcript_801/m.1689 type:complete len:173 (-) Transcript_801:215-733(-)|eukprot:CAMPEP_0172383088 /NCGR_PEP_ID=MMETSP1061-20121228/1021_1 /TAXON_ID=37318 /ORGANISM="Pseudo-nitzschia pungens, Strain cf. pungens" /LENGTH=172 /DNA_ID=CAMNT_0013111217 /DNA_START=179 /DNA_END=697 /DNA_ORIENTATION=-
MTSSQWTTNNSRLLISATIFALVIGTILVQKRVVPSEDEDEDGMPILPLNAVKYSQVPKVDTTTGQTKVFTATTTPKGLLNRHNTKVGTWGVIKVLKGTLEYKIAPRGNTMRREIEEEDDDVAYPTQLILSPGKQGIIEPQRYHKVVPGDDVEFIVEFHRLPGTGSVAEKRE